jgi:hypothetical protein
MISALTAGLLLSSSAVIALDTDFSLNLFPENSLAKCLDGSPAGFYHRASPTGSRSWVVHFEGGGACWSADDCLGRSMTLLGSSKTWSPTKMDDLDGGSHGFFSTDPEVNPDFNDWNMVRIQYCDGAFYAGDRVEPYPHNGTDLYFRGRYIVEETLSTLLTQFNMSAADQIIITGCSAGGIAVYLHLDWLRAHIPLHIPVVGAPDSGFFLDIPNYKGQYIWGPVYQGSYALHNTTFVDSDCLEAFKPADQYHCGGAEHTAQFVTTPMFVMNSLSDSYQFQHGLMLDCFQNATLVNCSKDELHAIARFRKTMIRELKHKVLNKPWNGAYLPTCLTHCGACTDPFWAQTNVHNVHLRDAFSSWYFQKSKSQEIVIDGPWPSNACKFSW